MRGLLHGTKGRVAVDHRWGLLALEDWGIGEGGTRGEVDRAAVVRAGGQTHSSEVVVKDVEGVAGIDLEEGLGTAVHCRSVQREDLAGAGQARYMGDAEEHWSRGHEEEWGWEPIVEVVERAEAFDPGFEFLRAADSRSSGQPEIVSNMAGA